MTPSHAESVGQGLVNSLQFRLFLDDGNASLRPMIDGDDLLAGYRNSTGRDPNRVLPPVSSVLLPTGEARAVLIGSCSCGVTGCGSLEMSVRREHGTVIWEPALYPQYETLSRSYRFELERYLDAVDAAIDDRPWSRDADELLRGWCGF